MSRVMRFEFNWLALWYRLTGKCLDYAPIDVGGWCYNCGHNKSFHRAKAPGGEA